MCKYYLHEHTLRVAVSLNSYAWTEVLLGPICKLN